jgi:hypothetical protein
MRSGRFDGLSNGWQGEPERVRPYHPTAASPVAIRIGLVRDEAQGLGMRRCNSGVPRPTDSVSIASMQTRGMPGNQVRLRIVGEWVDGESGGRSAGVLLAGLAAIGLALGCATDGGRFGPLRHGMTAAEVEAGWGLPTSITEYADDGGLQVRWEYRRNWVGERMYWSMEPRPVAGGQVVTVERRGVPYTRRYLAGYAVFQNGELIRWQAYPPPDWSP